MKNILIIFAFVLTCCTTLTSCFAPAAIFPAIAAVVSDASAVLSIIQNAVNSWFANKPNVELQTQINAAIANTWTALRVATAATQGAEKLSQEEYDEAFSEFQAAYSELYALLKAHGILKGTRLSMGVNQGEVDIPAPLAIGYKVQ